jgi:hypothetical protein
VDGYEARAEPLQTGKILVAGRLVDGPLAPELGLQGHHGDAVGLYRTIATALADQVVDEHPARRIGIEPALAPAPLFRRAGLVVEQDRDAFGQAQLLLDAVQLVAMLDPHAVGPLGADRILVGLVADHDDPIDPLRLELPGDPRRRQGAVDRLTAGHGDGVVVEDLVGDVDPGGDGRAYRQNAGMIVGPVAQVGEDVLGRREGRLADPRDALTAHVGVGLGVAVHPQHHPVAADAGHGSAALGHFGRTVVRTARAEPGQALHAGLSGLHRLVLLHEELQPVVHVLAGMETGDTPRDGAGDACRRQLAGRRQDPILVLVELADHPRAHVGAPVVELLLELVLDDRAFFLDHQDLVQALGELPDDLALQGPDHADLEQCDAEIGRLVVADPEVQECLANVQIGLARGHDAEARLFRVDHDLVQPIGPCEGQGGIDLVPVEPFFLLMAVVGPADVEAARRHLELIGAGKLDLNPLRVDKATGRGLDGFRDDLEADPAPRIARQRPAIDPEVEEVLHAGRRKHRDHGVHEGVFALVGGGRGLDRVIVAGDQKDAAVAGRAGHVAVPQDVAGAVHARPLGVPHGEGAVVAPVAQQSGLLAAPYGGGRQILVDARLEADVVSLEETFRAPELEVEAA